MKIPALSLNKETLRSLSETEAEQLAGGLPVFSVRCSQVCTNYQCPPHGSLLRTCAM